ncbi:hypothetical protein QFC20_007688 [Naganishia adeliensis]|uniref:Uncharacterized protein n=1 Tax=Naganishia adeliensis TaxID=92952 RepID=A0ACC2UWG3_9TREE|nr:hypothetical protein QFC20_007688 [Naganishia adeliensis]
MQMAVHDLVGLGAKTVGEERADVTSAATALSDLMAQGSETSKLSLPTSFTRWPEPACAGQFDDGHYEVAWRTDVNGDTKAAYTVKKAV